MDRWYLTGSHETRGQRSHKSSPRSWNHSSLRRNISRSLAGRNRVAASYWFWFWGGFHQNAGLILDVIRLENINKRIMCEDVEVKQVLTHLELSWSTRTQIHVKVLKSLTSCWTCVLITPWSVCAQSFVKLLGLKFIFLTISEGNFQEQEVKSKAAKDKEPAESGFSSASWRTVDSSNCSMIAFDF